MEPTPPPLPPAACPPDPAALRILLFAAVLTLIGDFLLWPAVPRLSLGLFAVASCAAILLTRPRVEWTRPIIAGCVLLALTAFQTAIEISFSNILVLLLLLAAILGEVAFPAIRIPWLRWTEGIWALLRAPKAWWWAGPVLKQLPRRPANVRSYIAVAIQVVLPTIVAVLVFAIFLARGNAIFAQWISEAFSTGLDLIPRLSPGRMVLWLLIGTFALGILRPAGSVLPEELATRAIPTFPEPRDLRLARWRTLSILAALNVLFFAVNTIDGLYLWITQALPAGVSYSDFVHQGVHSLTVAVLLSAVVLTLVYQQSRAVVSSRAVDILALVWIGQNVVLIAGVLMRLKLYVEAYQLSELRVYVAIFLLLVAVGFALLARRIVAARSLRWLLLTNALAAFMVFFIVQFLDVARWVADYNVARWQQDPARVLDVQYLAELGHSAYPALITVAETPGRHEAHLAFTHLQARKETERARLERENWRSWQIRHNRNSLRLVEHDIRTRR